MVKEYTHYASSVSGARVPLGRIDLAPGEHKLRVEAIAIHPNASRCYVGLAGLTIRPVGAAAAARGGVYNICLSDPVKTTATGRITTMEWLGPVSQGQHRIFFSLLAPNPQDAKRNPICMRTADNAAVLAAVRKLNSAGKVHINTYLYGNKPPEAEKVMKQIAKENGGRFRYVSPEE